MAQLNMQKTDFLGDLMNAVFGKAAPPSRYDSETPKYQYPERPGLFSRDLPPEPPPTSAKDILSEIIKVAGDPSNMGTFGLPAPALIKIPGKTLTIGGKGVKQELAGMRSGAVPHAPASAAAGFRGHDLLYHMDTPTQTVNIPRTADVPLDIFSGIHPQRFQTHTEHGTQRFLAGALRGDAPNVKYLRGSDVHYPLPPEAAKTRHPVAHSMSEELETMSGGARESTPLEIVSEIQPETNVSQQGLQLGGSTKFQGNAFSLSPRLAGMSGEPAYVFRGAVEQKPELITIMDDIQDAIESGHLGAPNEIGTTAWWMSDSPARHSPTENPYQWNSISMKTKMKRDGFNVDDLLDFPTNAQATEKLLRTFANNYGITIRENVIPQPVVATTARKSATEYDQKRLSEAMYNAARKDVLERGNIPMFGRLGYTLSRGGGGGEFTHPVTGVKGPAPFALDAYDEVPRKMGLIPDVVRMESEPGTKFSSNLDSWSQYMDPNDLHNHPLAKQIVSEGGFMEKMPGGGYSADLPVWLHPDEAKRLDELGYRTPEKGRGHEVMDQLADVERYKEATKPPLGIDDAHQVGLIVNELNSASADPKTFLSTLNKMLGDYDTRSFLEHSGDQIRFNMTPKERLATREYVQSIGKDFDPKPTDLKTLLQQYGVAQDTRTIKDYINFTGGNPNDRENLLNLLASKNPMVKKNEYLISRLVHTNNNFGTPAFNRELVKQIVEGKHKYYAKDMKALVDEYSTTAIKNYTSSNYMPTSINIRKPDFTLSLNERGHIALSNLQQEKAMDKVGGKVRKLIGSYPIEDQGNFNLAINRGRVDESVLTYIARHPQQFRNIMKDPQYQLLLDSNRVLNSRHAADKITKIYDAMVRKYKPGGANVTIPMD